MVGGSFPTSPTGSSTAGSQGPFLAAEAGREPGGEAELDPDHGRGVLRGESEALLSCATVDRLGANDDPYSDLENRRVELELGYGLPAFGGQYTATPELALGVSNTGRDLKVSWRIAREQRAGDVGSLELSVEATRREAANDESGAEHQVGGQLQARF